MATSSLPELPVEPDEFIPYLASRKTPVIDLITPYKTFDTKIRELFAQEPEHAALQDPLVNVIPVFSNGNEAHVKIRARDLTAETQEEKDKYMMPLSDEDRMADGSPAIVESLKEFQQNFNVFTELALSDLDWSNVVVAGSAAVTPLIPVPEKYRGSKRALRQYYHEILAPASDVDIFRKAHASKRFESLVWALANSLLSLWHERGAGQRQDQADRDQSSRCHSHGNHYYSYKSLVSDSCKRLPKLLTMNAARSYDSLVLSYTTYSDCSPNL